MALMAILKVLLKIHPLVSWLADSPLDRLEAALQTFLNSSPDFLIVFSNVIYVHTPVTAAAEAPRALSSLPITCSTPAAASCDAAPNRSRSSRRCSICCYLVQNRDRVVSKDDLIASVWGGRIVSDSTLTSRIYAARKGDRRQRRAPEADPHHRAQGPPLRRRCARATRRATPALQADPPPDDLRRLSRPPLPLPDRPAIAVLPFSNMSGDPEQEYFSDGISEDIITALSKLRWFFVIARNSSFTYKGKAVHLKQVAEELGVGYVLEGSVRKSGGRVRITAQLNDVATGSHVWAERYDRDVADVFAVQDEITESIVAAIEPQLYAAENFRARRKPPGSLDAWDLVMRALSHYWRVTRQDHVVAQALLEKAIAIDPNYGQALGVLAASYTFGAHMGWEDWKTSRRSPSVPRWRRSAPTAKTPGRIMRLAPSI